MEQRYSIRPREAAVEAIQSYIIQNGLKAGDKLPSERDMCAMWSLNRSTLRLAIARLIRDGALETKQGAGIFYAGPKYRRELQGLDSFRTASVMQNRDCESRIVFFEQVECDGLLLRLFRAAPGAQVWRLDRLRLTDDCPLELESAFFLVDRFPDIDRFDFIKDSLYRVFEEEYGAVPTQGDERITATRAESGEAALLDVPDGTPVFRVESKTCDQNGALLEYCRVLIRSDRVVLTSRMTRTWEEGHGDA